MSNTAIIGIGRWGKNIARELFALNVLGAYAHTGSSDDDIWAQEHLPGIPKFELQTILNDMRIANVCVATPPETHRGIVEQLLRAEKNVFVEKPFGTSSHTARKLVNLAKKQQLKVFTGYVFLYHPAYQKFKEMFVQNNTPTVSVTWEKYGTFNNSLVFNLLSHHAAISLDLFGVPNKIEIKHASKTVSELDELAVDLIYNDHRFSSQIKRDSTITQHALTAGEIVIDLHNTPLNSSTALHEELKAFLNYANDATIPPTEGAFAVHVLEICEQVIKQLPE